MSSDYPSIAEKNPGYSEQNRESERKKKFFFLPLPQSTTYDRGRGKQKQKQKQTGDSRDLLPVPSRPPTQRFSEGRESQRRRTPKRRKTTADGEVLCVTHVPRNGWSYGWSYGRQQESNLGDEKLKIE